MEVIPKEGGSVVHWILEYEKLKDHTFDPLTMLQFDIDMTKDVDAHLVASN